MASSCSTIFRPKNFLVASLIFAEICILITSAAPIPDLTDDIKKELNKDFKDILAAVILFRVGEEVKTNTDIDNTSAAPPISDLTGDMKNEFHKDVTESHPAKTLGFIDILAVAPGILFGEDVKKTNTDIDNTSTTPIPDLTGDIKMEFHKDVTESHPAKTLGFKDILAAGVLFEEEMKGANIDKNIQQLKQNHLPHKDHKLNDNYKLSPNANAYSSSARSNSMKVLTYLFHLFVYFLIV